MSSEWAPQNSFGGFPANFDFQDISQYVETYFWAAQGGAVGLQCLCKTWCVLLKTSSQNEHNKKQFGGFPANFDFQDISQYEETHFWAVRDGAVRLQCVCRCACVWLRRVYRMSTQKFFRRLSSDFRFLGHITVCRDLLLGCGGWCSGAAMPLQNLMCVA